MINHLGKLAILPLTVGICMHATALEKMDDSSLSQVSGQDGLAISAELDQASIGEVKWLDGNVNPDGTAATTAAGSLKLSNVAINPATGQTNVRTDITLETGASASGAGFSGTLALKNGVNVAIPELSICDKDGLNSSCESLGSLSVNLNGDETSFSLITTNGLFNKQGTARLKAIIDNLSVAVGQKQGGQTNQLILGDLYANMTADGSLYVSNQEGLTFVGKISFDDRVFDTTTRKGLEVLVQHKSGASTAMLGKLAVSGDINLANLSLRGVSGTVTGLGFDNGTNGVAMRMQGALASNADAKPFKLQLGGGDGDGMRMAGWQGFADGSSARFDSGSVYLNVIPQGQTTSIPVNTRLTAVNADTVATANAMAANSGTNFKKEAWATSNPNLVANSGNDTAFLTKDNFVTDTDGNIVDVYKGYTHDNARGLVDADGNRLALTTLKDGYVTQKDASGNDVVYTFPGDGSSDGTFSRIYIVDDATGDTTTPLIIQRYDQGAYGDGTGNNYRGQKYVHVWRTGSGANNAGNDRVVTAGSENSGLDANNWQKAIDFYRRTSDGAMSGANLSGNNLSGLSTVHYVVNDFGELRRNDQKLQLRNHRFNASNGYLVTGTDTAGTNYVTKNGQYFAIYNNLLVKSNASGQPVDESGSVTNDIDSMVVVAQLASRASFLAKNTKGLTTTEDFALSPTSGRVVAVAVRGAELQGVATQTEFFKTDASGNDTQTDTQNWSVSPVLYGVNANIHMKGKTLTATDSKSLTKFAGQTAAQPLLEAGEAIQLDVVASTKGRNTDETKTTGLLIVDGDTKRYTGLRNVDSFVKASGTLQINSQGMALDMPNTKIVARGELATGSLASVTKGTDSNGRGTQGGSDRLFGVDARFNGDISALVSGGSNGFKANARVKIDPYKNQGMMLSLSAPDNKGRLLFDRISGTVDIKDLTINNAMNAGKGMMNVKSTMVINPENTVSGDLRIRDLSFNAKQADSNGVFNSFNDVRLGEMALTQHTIYSDVKIRGAE